MKVTKHDVYYSYLRNHKNLSAVGRDLKICPERAGDILKELGLSWDRTYKTIQYIKENADKSPAQIAEDLDMNVNWIRTVARKHGLKLARKYCKRDN